MSSLFALSIPTLLESFAVAFGVAITLFFLMRQLSFFQKLVLRSEASRTKSISFSFRLGGIGILLSFWAAFLVDDRLTLSPGLVAFLLGSIAVLCIGVWDDIRPLSWRLQLVFQMVLALLLIAFGLSIEIMQGLFGGTWNLREWAPFLPALALFFWVILIMNAVNWLDGLDGLLGSVSIIGFLTLLIVSLLPEVNQPAIAILSAMLVGSTLAFLLFNWYPARLIAGTTGAYFLGFALATLSVMAGAKVATALLVLTLPVIDALWVLFERFRAGDSLFKPDTRHLHYRLIELGWSTRTVAFTYTGITLGMAFLALETRAFGKLVVFLGALLIIIGVCAVASFLTQQKGKSL